MKIRDLAISGMLSAVLILMKTVLASVPNVELVTLLVILYTLHFGKKVFYIIYVFVFVEIAVYGLGIWSVNYLYIWTLLALFVWRYRARTDKMFWAFTAGFFGLFFGSLTSIPYFFIGGFPLAAGYWIQGLVFDVIHFIGNFLSVLIFYRPLSRILKTLS